MAAFSFSSCVDIVKMESEHGGFYTAPSNVHFSGPLFACSNSGSEQHQSLVVWGRSWFPFFDDGSEL